MSKAEVQDLLDANKDLRFMKNCADIKLQYAGFPGVVMAPRRVYGRFVGITPRWIKSGRLFVVRCGSQGLHTRKDNGPKHVGLEL